MHNKMSHMYSKWNVNINKTIKSIKKTIDCSKDKTLICS